MTARGTEVLDLYEGLPGPRFRVPITVAEMTKYADNSFHALKVAFANEIGAICSSLGVDSYDVMDIFLADTKLNVSPAYLRPGFAFGGSCLPKDVRALSSVARSRDVSVPVLGNLIASNKAHIERALDSVVALNRRKIGLFGLTFKSGTDDLRESPLVELVESLIGKGFEVSIFDPILVMARLMGDNLAQVEDRLPHLTQLLVEDPQRLVQDSDVLIVGSRDESVLTALAGVEAGVDVLDLVRLPDDMRAGLGADYHAIAW